MSQTDTTQNIGSGPHDPEPPPPDPKAVLDAISAGATPEHGALRTAEGIRFLHLHRGGWLTASSPAGAYRLDKHTYDALVDAIKTKAPWRLFGQRVGLVPRVVAGELRAVLEAVARDDTPGGPTDPDLSAA